MVRDYANFGFDRADVVVAVGYDLVEYSPERWNPNRDKRIVHIHRTVAEVDAHYSLEVGLQGSIGATLDAIAGSADMHAIAGAVPPVTRLGARGAGARRGGRLVPAEAAADGGGHPFGDGPRGHRPVRHRRGEDVDGSPLPDVSTQHVPDLQRPRHDGLLPARRVRREAGAPRAEGARRDGRRSVPDERGGDRDRGPRAACRS